MPISIYHKPGFRDLPDSKDIQNCYSWSPKDSIRDASISAFVMNVLQNVQLLLRYTQFPSAGLLMTVRRRNALVNAGIHCNQIGEKL